MVQKSKILIEKFPNGMTLRWNDESGRIAPEKEFAPGGQEAVYIGGLIADGVIDLLGQSAKGMVEVLVEIRPL